jgi:Ran GTPase-activating protein (RanGAP) involved in mRNA processing and transport
MTTITPKRNNFAVDLADWKRTLVSINHVPTDHLNTRWNPPATQHNQSATTMTKPTIAVARNITPTPTNTHCVTKSTPQATLQHDGVIVGEQHNAPIVSAVTPQRKNAVYDKQLQHYVVLAGEHQNTPGDDVVIPLRDNTLKNDSKIERVKCIDRSHKNLRDDDLDEIIKEMETSTVLMEVNLYRNQITLADGRFATALASNASLLKINLCDNKIGDDGVRSLCAALKVNKTLTSIDLSGTQISKVGAQLLAEALLVNTVLQSMNLVNNMIGEDGAQSLGDALKVNNNLRCINLSGNQISTVGAKFLAETLMVNTSLVDISLSNNKIGDEGAQSIGDALKVNKTLTRISLSWCHISTVGVKFLAEALMVNTSLVDISLSNNKIGVRGALSLCDALKVNKTLNFINLSGCQICTVGAKFLADALRENTSLVDVSLSGNKIHDKGAQSLADSFRKNRSLRTIQLCSNRITDIGATKLADAIEFNCDCVVTMLHMKGNQVSADSLDRIKSICKAKERSKGKGVSLNDITQIPGQKARDRKRQCALQIVGSIASKDDQIASLKEHIALLEKDIARLNDNLRHSKPLVETIDLTTDEAERATKRSRTESDVKSNLAIMYEQNQKIVQIKQENVATQLANHAVMSTFNELREDLEDAHKILHEHTQRVIHIKKEKMDTEMALESIRGEKNDVEADLKVVKEDLEDANELVGQMSLTTDIWQGRFDELVALMESGKADGASINAIRNRPLGSGK